MDFHETEIEQMLDLVDKVREVTRRRNYYYDEHKIVELLLKHKALDGAIGIQLAVDDLADAVSGNLFDMLQEAKKRDY